VTATYFAFHDDVLTRLIARQAEMQFAYEDRIAEIARASRPRDQRQLLDQDQFERRLDHSSSGRPRSKRAPPRSARWPIRPSPAPSSRTRAARAPATRRPPRPNHPDSDKAVFTAPPDREARFELRGATPR